MNRCPQFFGLDRLYRKKAGTATGAIQVCFRLIKTYRAPVTVPIYAQLIWLLLAVRAAPALV